MKVGQKGVGGQQSQSISMSNAERFQRKSPRRRNIQSLVYRNAFHDEKTLDCRLSRKVCCSACSFDGLGSPQKS